MRLVKVGQFLVNYPISSLPCLSQTLVLVVSAHIFLIPFPNHKISKPATKFKMLALKQDQEGSKPIKHAITSSDLT